NVGQHISLFVAGVKDKVAIKLIAAKGKVQVQAQGGEMELTADQDVSITSTKTRITVAAKEEITLTSGGGYIRLKGGNIEIHCPGTVSFKGGKHEFGGGASLQVQLPTFPEYTPPTGPFSARYRLFKDDNCPYEGYKYEIRDKDGNILKKGVTDSYGWTEFVNTDQASGVEIYQATMRETERITEPWEARLEHALRQAVMNNSKKQD
ncbi:MAG: DUF2345 domain-containing protein, partial [Rhodocyclales bacterium]|nr:DUF2345 domain-containing protein [Rhodocyclales bacterium]